MRIIAILSLLLLSSPVFGELTKEDIRTIIKEEVRPIIKEEITTSEKRTREHIDLKIETVNTPKLMRQMPELMPWRQT